MLKVFIGHDSRDQQAAEVCKYSILKYASIEVEFHFLNEEELRLRSLFTRMPDHEDFETKEAEHLYTRFLVPHFCGYTGWAVYVDCDFLFIDDIAKLLELKNDRYALQLVKHKYQPLARKKLNNRPQRSYPRKNWTSMMLINCEHPEISKLTVDFVNNEPKDCLIRLEWLPNRSIGELKPEWNWLVGWHKEPIDGEPRALHYTEGGPWLPAAKHVEYGVFWWKLQQEMEQAAYVPLDVTQPESILPELKSIYEKLMYYRVDPAGKYYNITKQDIINDIDNLNNNAVYAVEAEFMDVTNSKHENKGHQYDPFLQSFIMGSGGQITVWDKVKASMVPVVLRGVTKRKQMKACREANRDFYYIDTGYFGNGRKKLYHRITKNNMQNIGPVIHRTRDRLSVTGYQARKFKLGGKILLAPPSQKLLQCYDLDLETWITQTKQEIGLYTDREIVVREKQGRSVRVTTDTMEMALSKDIYCLVTFSSIAAVEAVMLGKPAIVLGPSAAYSVCSDSLEEIEKLYIPTLDEVEEWAAHLAYCQFTEAEMRDGTAWKILNENA